MKYDHAFALGFSVHSDHDAENVTVQELWAGLVRRVDDLQSVPGELAEACGLPFDTVEE